MKISAKALGLLVLSAWAIGAIGGPESRAGVFNLPHFVTPGEFAIGIEPELTLTNGAGLGANIKYTHGFSDLLNLTGVIGTSGGPRKFRVGANLTFDFFPDIEGQPGIGIAASGMYYQLATVGQVEFQAIPYIHKSFQNGEIEPFIAAPVGLALADGRYAGVTTVAFGSMFKTMENFRVIVEFGLGLNNADSYVSGGFVYYH